MSNNSISNYSALLRQVKQRVALAQQRAIYAANEELLRMYWDLGQMLSQAKNADGWGKETIVQPAVAQLPEYNFSFPILHLHWTHNVILMQRVKDIKARYWYMIQCLTSVKPIGISDYELGQALPKDLRSSLPSIEDIEAEFDEKMNIQ